MFDLRSFVKQQSYLVSSSKAAKVATKYLPGKE
jgi:hypothetical protein